MKNYGVLEGRRKTDYIGGTLHYEERTDGNWEKWLPEEEKQKSKYADSMACVSYSLINCLETQEFQLTGIRPNYSDRFLALMSETTPQGNYLYKVADTVRKIGLVKEESWPAPKDFTWESYYERPSDAKMKELLAEGQEWLKTHEFAYEWLTNNQSVIEYHLKHVPLQLVIPGHAIEGFDQIDSTERYFDTYAPHIKSTTVQNLSDVLKPVLNLKNMKQFKTQNYKGELRVVLQASTIEQWNALCTILGVDPKIIDETIN